MTLQYPPKEELFANTLKARSLRVFVVCLVFVILAVLTTVISGPGKAIAATNGTINFQARLQNAAGNIAADGSYNVEFKLYNASTGGTALWTEDYLNQNSQGVTVKNGYLTVNLGSITALPNTINYDQDLWLTMTVRGTGSCAFAACTPADAEMSPRLKLTASAYAFRAGQVAQFNSSTGFTSTLGIAAPTGGNQTFVIQDQGAAGTYSLLTSSNGLQLQASYPGTTQTGNFSISGTGGAGTFNATSGFQLNGTAGATTTCSGGQILSNQVVQGGIVTGGTCATVSGGGGGGYVTLQASTPGTADTGSFNISGTGIAATLQATTFDTASAVALNIGTTNATQINLNQNVVVATGKNLTVTNGTVYSNAFDRATSGPMTIGTTNSTAITIGASTTATTINNSLTVKATTDSRPLGSELMTSSYGFSAAAGWTSISGTGQSATATHDGTNNSTALPVSPALSLSAGIDYQISFTVSGRTTGYVQVYVGGVMLTSTLFTTSQTITFTAPASGNVTFVPYSSSPGFDGTITNVSIKAYGAAIPATFTLQNAASTAVIEMRATADTSNLFVGRLSGQNITTGFNNVALGSTALQSTSTGYGNTAIGSQTLTSNKGGNSNTAIGSSALNATTGSGNAAIGFYSQLYNTTGSYNTSVGTNSLTNLTNAWHNTSIGYYSMYSITTGGSNTVVGDSAGQGYGCSSGAGCGANGNAIFGYQAGYQIQTGANYNVMQGYNAGYSITTGAQNVLLGYNAGYQESNGHFKTLATLQNATAIGAYAQVQANNSIVLGSVDNATNVGIGTTMPSNTFSVSPLDYQTGTVTRTNSSTTLAGTGTTWTSAMVGDLIVFADGTTNTVAGFTDATHVTMGATYAGTTDASPVYYRFHKKGLQVTSTGNVGVGNVSPAYALDVTGDVNSTTLYRINGTAGASIACSGGNLLQNATVSGGIVTGGSCVAAGGGSGVTIVGALDGGTYSDNGASISGSTIYLQAASGTHTGLVTYGAQTFGGVKTFAAGMTVGGAFVLQEAAAPAGATGYGKLYVSSSDHNLHFVNASGTDISLGAGGGYSGMHTIKIAPEFPNSVFTTGGQSATAGYMQTDLDTGLTAAQGYKHTYYSWTTDQATAQTYDITMLYQIPSDFTSFATGSFKLWAYGTDSTKNSATVIVKDVDGTQCMSQAITLTNLTWTQTVLPDLTSGGCSFAANDLITITIRPSSSTATTNETRIGEIQFSYN